MPKSLGYTEKFFSLRESTISESLNLISNSIYSDSSSSLSDGLWALKAEIYDVLSEAEMAAYSSNDSAFMFS